MQSGESDKRPDSLLIDLDLAVLDLDRESVSFGRDDDRILRQRSQCLAIKRILCVQLDGTALDQTKGDGDNSTHTLAGETIDTSLSKA
jgi:hypothetical protein